jgi:phage-related holin
MTAPPTPGDRRDWLDDAKNVRTIVRALIAISAIAFLGSALYASHGFAIEAVFGFYGVYGFVACVALVMIAKAMRRVLMRPESYYDDDRY